MAAFLPARASFVTLLIHLNGTENRSVVSTWDLFIYLNHTPFKLPTPLRLSELSTYSHLHTSRALLATPSHV